MRTYRTWLLALALIAPFRPALAQNAPPIVNITSPATLTTYVAPASFTLSADASDPDGSVAAVHFFSHKYGDPSPTHLATSFAPPYTHSAVLNSASAYALHAVAVDNNRAQSVASVGVYVAVQAPQVYFVHSDHLNTPRLVADATGTTVWRWDQQEPFGVNVPDENPSGLGLFDLPLRLPGQYFDKETNLHYNYHRDYDPSIGRYGESDPVGLKAGLNTYAYVSGNPLIWNDPLGLQTSTIQCNGKGEYEIVNVNKGCDRICTQIHEQVHVDDWKRRYGADSCRNKPKGYLPTEGSGYNEFLRQSECWAYTEGKACRQALISGSCPCPEAKKGIERDDRELRANRCTP
jgi:RHS repeat-associated protein